MPLGSLSDPCWDRLLGQLIPGRATKGVSLGLPPAEPPCLFSPSLLSDWWKLVLD